MFWNLVALVALLTLQATVVQGNPNPNPSYNYPIPRCKLGKRCKRERRRLGDPHVLEEKSCRPLPEPCSGKDTYSCFLTHCLNGDLLEPYGTRDDCIKMQYCALKDELKVELEKDDVDAEVGTRIALDSNLMHLFPVYGSDFDCEKGFTDLNDMLQDYDCVGLECKCKTDGSFFCIRPVENYDDTCYESDSQGVCQNKCKEEGEEPKCKAEFMKCPSCTESEFYKGACPSWLPQAGEEVTTGDGSVVKLGEDGNTIGDLLVGRKDKESCSFVACEASSDCKRMKKRCPDGSIVTKSIYSECRDWLPCPGSTTPPPTISLNPSSTPSQSPTSQPSIQPSAIPSHVPSIAPSASPSAVISLDPSSTPSQSPTSQPSGQPSAVPSHVPSIAPSASPSSVISLDPSSTPSQSPSSQPSGQPSAVPSHVPSIAPSASPSSVPSSVPSGMPSSAPSSAPSPEPTCDGETEPYLCNDAEIGMFWVGRSLETCQLLPCDTDVVYPLCPGVFKVEFCWDGSLVTMDPSNDCKFLPCPPEPSPSQSPSKSQKSKKSKKNNSGEEP